MRRTVESVPDGSKYFQTVLNGLLYTRHKPSIAKRDPLPFQGGLVKTANLPKGILIVFCVVLTQYAFLMLTQWDTPDFHENP